MAGEVSEKELASVLTHAMLAQKILRPHCDRLLHLLRQLQQPPGPSDDYFAARLREFALDVEHINPAFADGVQELAGMWMDNAVTLKHMVELAPEIGNVSFIGIRPAARYLSRCIEIAAENGARLALSPDFAVVPDGQLYDALVAQRLPARPTTQAEAFSRVEAAFYAVKLAQEHHLPRCIESLGISPPSVTGEPEDEDDPVAAATEDLAKTDLSDPAPATGEPPQVAARSRVDADKARDDLDRACTLVSLAVSHIDLAVAVIAGLLDPKEVASLSECTDRAASIAEDRFLQFKVIKTSADF